MYDIRKSKILIIDDSQIDINILTKALETHYEINAVNSGSMALEYMSNHIPDLILQDIVMKGMDGFEICTTLKKNPQTKNIPIIFITAVDDSDYKTRGFEIGAVDYITKPFDIQEVKARVKTHLMLKTAQEVLKDQNFVLEERIRERELELIKAYDLIQQSQKMEAIGTLASGIAHDFNNILTPILIQTELALMKIPEDSNIKSHLTKVHKASQRAKKMVNLILSFSRGSQEMHKPFQMGMIVKEALKLLRASLPTTIEIRQNIQEKLDMIIGDPTQIHQILMNLCTNASHAMRKNGGILEVNLVKVSQVSSEMEQLIGLEPKDYLKLSVKDTGCGMDSEIMKRIYEPYFTTKDKTEGTGLGLSVVHKIITDYGGGIMVDSELEKGTTFNIFLPSVKDIPLSQTKGFEKPQLGVERILFIDDEDATVEATQAMLEFLGYQVVGITSAMEALEFFKQDPNGFDIIISDQTMPKMTGLELIEQMLAIRPDIPVILCTGYSEAITDNKLDSLGIKTLLMKPFEINTITEAIRRALEKS